ncbi:energy transducer TonB family protein [Pelagibacterium lentulum]|uniref:TonB C-terminal domain-containing protein n=1 Tax=Pelagibacterium lentulum TaxID=2029865 RepID=A0A916RIA7_9HYPH|nr:TonB family protein [Pelagibacterium lentulum]GGA57516.1 hypothetical protein GCM10011499_29630 [Pelagibacterium lentulum]
MTLRAWTIAITASLLLHLLLAAWFTPRPQTIEIAGGMAAEVSIVGNTFADAVSAGAVPTQIADATDVTAEIEQETSTALAPEATQVIQPVEMEIIEAVETQSIDPDSIIVALENQTSHVVERETAVEPIVRRNVTEAETLEIETLVQQDRSDPETVASEQVTEVLVVEPEAPPTPPARPAGLAAQPTPQPVRTASAAGSGGTAPSDTRQGVAQGGATGNAASTGQAANSQAGNAAVSNYPGQVAAALGRALRYPSNARGATGQSLVSFTVAANGQLVGAQIRGSSGNAVLDQAAIATVQRAAPFPPIPPAAGRNQWSFTLPLSFTR